MTGESKGHDLFSKIDQHKNDMERLRWEGDFSEYVDMVVENPALARTAHQTVYNALTQREDFFTTGRNALFGAEETTQKFLDVLRAGAERLEVGKRIILLVGPPGSGKSTLVNGTKRAIEEYSRTEEGAVYALKGCQMHEDPLHLIPEDMRSMLDKEYGIHIEGNLCPHCAEKYGAQEFTADSMKEVQVERVMLSEKDRIGVGTFKPSDPKSQDITELIGSVDFSRLAELGSASEAGAYRFDGELNIANRGMMEFVEMLKSDEKFLYVLLDLAQDRVVKSPRFPNLSVDEVILAHTNMTEYNRYVNDPKNEAIRDRMFVIKVPYTLRVSDEHKIHEKLIGESEQVKKSAVHINPNTLETAAMFAVLSRLKSSAKYSKVQKMRIYNGEEIDGLTQRDIKELRSEYPDEGMTGISPRYIIDSISMALTTRGSGKACLTPIDTIRALRDNLEHHAQTRDMKKEDKDALINDITTVKNEYDAQVTREIMSAFVHSYKDAARSLCDNYLENVEAYTARTKVVDPITDEESSPDEKLMRSIEEQIGVSENSKKEFRNEILIRIGSTLRNGGTFDHTSHPRLREAIEKKLFADMKDIVKLTTSAKVPNQEQQERLRGVEQTLIDEHDYCPHCASEVVRYVGTLMSRA